MNRRNFLRTTSAAGGFALMGLAGMRASAAPAGAGARPNILLFFTDDQNDLGGWVGHNEAITPNMDRLARRGVCFTNAHVASYWCAPSRSALMTGRHPVNTGWYDDQPFFAAQPDVKDIPRYFHDHGYATYGGGKVYHHMPGYVNLAGYDEYFHWDPTQKTQGWGYSAWSENNRATPPGAPLSKAGRELGANLEHGTIPDEAEKDMADTLTTDYVIGLLKQPRDRPFLITLGLYAPHKPNYAPKKYIDQYPLEGLYKPPIKEDDNDDIPAAYRINRKNYDQLQALGEQQSLVRHYLACITYADAQLGRVLDALEASPYADNTIVVFWADHGWHLGEKFKYGKHTPYERTSNVPFIWAGPGVPREVRCDVAVPTLDTFATLAELAGLPPLEGLKEFDSRSLRPLFANPQLDESRVVLQSLAADHHAAITTQWRYIRRPDGSEELYDSLKDPHEWTNLAGTPEAAAVIKELAARLPASPAVAGPGKKAYRIEYEGERIKWTQKPAAEVDAAAEAGGRNKKGRKKTAPDAGQEDD